MNSDQLFTLDSLLTMGGASLAVTLVGNTFRYIFGWNPRWLGLIIALGIAGLGVATKSTVTWVDGVVAFFQGLQIFAAAVGIASITNAGTSGDGTRGLELRLNMKSFWISWF